MREYMCKQCGRKQYSTARLHEQKHPECVHCGAKQMFETDATRDTSIEVNFSTVCEAAITGAPTLDQAIIAAHVVRTYCQEVGYCDKEHICPLGHMINCYESDGGPAIWDVPNPEDIGLCSNPEDISIGTIAADKGGE